MGDHFKFLATITRLYSTLSKHPAFCEEDVSASLTNGRELGLGAYEENWLHLGRRLGFAHACRDKGTTVKILAEHKVKIFGVIAGYNVLRLGPSSRTERQMLNFPTHSSLQGSTRSDESGRLDSTK